HAPPTAASYPLSLHDALPISRGEAPPRIRTGVSGPRRRLGGGTSMADGCNPVACVSPTNAWYLGRESDGTNPDTALSGVQGTSLDRKSTRLNSSHVKISYAVC